MKVRVALNIKKIHLRVIVIQRMIQSRTKKGKIRLLEQKKCSKIIIATILLIFPLFVIEIKFAGVICERLNCFRF